MEDLEIKGRLIAGPPPVVLATMTGKLNATTAPEFEKFVNAVNKQKITRVILDIPDLKYMGSTGFDKAVEFAGTLKDAGGGVHIAHASPKIQVVFGTLGLNTVFTLFPDVDSAVREWIPTGLPPARVPTGAVKQPSGAVKQPTGAVKPPTGAVRPPTGAARQPTGPQTQPATGKAPALQPGMVPGAAPAPAPAFMPDFDGALQQLQAALSGRGMRSDIVHVYREDLHAGKQGLAIRLPVPSQNEARARETYEQARAHDRGMVLRVVCIADGSACTMVKPGAAGGSVTLDIPADLEEATVVRGGFGWWWRRTFGGTVAGKTDQIPSRK